MRELVRAQPALADRARLAPCGRSELEACATAVRGRRCDRPMLRPKRRRRRLRAGRAASIAPASSDSRPSSASCCCWSPGSSSTRACASAVAGAGRRRRGGQRLSFGWRSRCCRSRIGTRSRRTVRCAIGRMVEPEPVADLAQASAAHRRAHPPLPHRHRCRRFRAGRRCAVRSACSRTAARRDPALVERIAQSVDLVGATTGRSSCCAMHDRDAGQAAATWRWPRWRGSGRPAPLAGCRAICRRTPNRCCGSRNACRSRNAAVQTGVRARRSALAGPGTQAGLRSGWYRVCAARRRCSAAAHRRRSLPRCREPPGAALRLVPRCAAHAPHATRSLAAPHARPRPTRAPCLPARSRRRRRISDRRLDNVRRAGAGGERRPNGRRSLGGARARPRAAASMRSRSASRRGLTFDDVVLPTGQCAMLRDIARQLRQRERVYGEWGFGAQAPARPGPRGAVRGRVRHRQDAGRRSHRQRGRARPLPRRSRRRWSASISARPRRT